MGGGGFLTIGCCFPYCLLEIFVGDKALIEGDKVVMEDPQPPLGKPWIREVSHLITCSRFFIKCKCIVYMNPLPGNLSPVTP